MSSVTTQTYKLETRTTAYDRLSGALATGVLVFGTLSLLLFMMWLTMISPKRNANLVVNEVLLPGDPGEEKPLGVADDILEPGVEDFPEVDVPQLADAVEAVTDAPSRFRGMLAAVDGNAAEMGKGRGLGAIGGGGGGGGGKAYERWVIEYESDNISVYIDQLKAFGIQVGAVHKVLDEIDLIFDLGANPQARPTRRSEEKRVYFVHTLGKLKNFDMRFAKQAGINPTGKIMVQFYPPETSKMLAELEAAEANQRGLELNKIRRTVFKVRAAGSGFEYYVADMQQK